MAKLSLNIFQISLSVIAGSALFFSTIVMSYQQVPPTAQSTQGAQPTVKITSPKSGESVPISGNLTISGTSSDTGTSLVGTKDRVRQKIDEYADSGAEQFFLAFHDPYNISDLELFIDSVH